MQSKKDRKKYRKKRSKLKNLILLLLLAFILAGIATNFNVIVKWTIPASPIVITLEHPNAGETLATNTTYFKYNGSGGSAPLWYAWYCDILITFNSPFLRAIDVNSTKNYTALPFADGNYYWRVEATDNSTVNISSIRAFTIKTDPLNTFPVISSPQVSPLSGTTANNFVYSCIYTDADNDTPSYMRVYIDGIAHDMSQVTPADTNMTDGKSYQYTTTLSVGLHTYMMIGSDGTAINGTILYNNPLVTEATPTNGTPPVHVKINKVTINPINTESFPGGTFDGMLSITQEGNSTWEYEVFWYLMLIDSNGSIVEQLEGALAISTTVVTAYRILVPFTVPPGNYSLLAKTYDMDSSDSLSTQLGMDEVYVTITEEPIGSELYDFLLGNTWLLIVMIALAVALAFIAWKKKKGYLLVFAVGIAMILLIVFHVVQFHFFSFVGVLLTMMGGFMFTKSFKKTFTMIKSPRIIRLIGALLVFSGVMLYFKMLW